MKYLLIFLIVIGCRQKEQKSSPIHRRYDGIVFQGSGVSFNANIIFKIIKSFDEDSTLATMWIDSIVGTLYSNMVWRGKYKNPLFIYIDTSKHGIFKTSTYSEGGINLAEFIKGNYHNVIKWNPNGSYSMDSIFVPWQDSIVVWDGIYEEYGFVDTANYSMFLKAKNDTDLVTWDTTNR